MLFSLIASNRDSLVQQHLSDGFYIGLNDGPAAGQAGYLHLDLNSRYQGGRPLTRGSVRLSFRPPL